MTNPDQAEPTAETRRPVGIGVIGAGWMGRLHSRAMLRVRHHYPELALTPRLVAVADPVESRRETMREEFGFPSVVSDWHEIIANPEIQIVSVTTPNYLHAEVAIAAARAGKHVWVEKPSGRQLSETRDIAQAVKDAGVMSAVGLDYRCAPAVVRAKSLVESGALGNPIVYRGWFLADYANSPDGVLSWRFERALAGTGVIGDLLPHVADMALYLVGPIGAVTADAALFIPQRPRPSRPDSSHFARDNSLQMGEVENEDYLAMMVRFGNGARGVLECGRTLPGHHVAMAFELYCQRGSVSWSFERMNELEISTPSSNSEVESFGTRFAQRGYGDFDAFQPGPGIAMGYDDLKVIEASHLLASIASMTQESPNIADMLRAAEVMDAAERSAQSRSWIQIEESTIAGADRRH
jgi:predicted dehydrogenase